MDRFGRSDVATGGSWKRMRASERRSDTGHWGVRAGQLTTVRKHFIVGLKELKSLWVVRKGSTSVCVSVALYVCVRVIQNQREENRKAPTGSAWCSTDKNTEVNDLTHTRQYFTLCSHVKRTTPRP